MHSRSFESRPFAALLLSVATTAVVFSTGCSSTTSPTSASVANVASREHVIPPPRPAESATGELPPSIVRGLAYLEAQPALAPSAVLVLHYLRRWYGLTVFPDLDDRYRIALNQGNTPGLPEDWKASYLRVMHRIISPTVKINLDGRARWEDFAAAMFARGGVNVITIPALYCDQIPYPMAYTSILESGRRAGGYELTHVGMALRWIDENGCTSPMDAGFEPTVANDIAELVDPTDGVTDLDMESTAFLMYMGRRDLVREDMLVAIVDAQRPNGGWSDDSSDPSLTSAWHPTSMALWALLGQHEPEVEMSPMIVPAEFAP